MVGCSSIHSGVLRATAGTSWLLTLIWASYLTTIMRGFDDLLRFAAETTHPWRLLHSQRILATGFTPTHRENTFIGRNRQGRRLLSRNYSEGKSPHFIVVSLEKSAE